MEQPHRAGAFHRFRSRGHEDDIPSSPSGSARKHVQDTTPRLACLRCRRIKKKCDRAIPECRVCTKAGAECHYQDHHRNNHAAPASAYVADLERRVEWLSARVDSFMPQSVLPPAASSDSGTDQISRDRMEGRPDTAHSLTKSHPGGVLGAPLSPGGTVSRHKSPTSDAEGQMSSLRSNPSSGAFVSSSTPVTPAATRACLIRSEGQMLPANRHLPHGLTHMDLVQGYFSHVHRAYPFLDQVQTLEEAVGVIQVFKASFLPFTAQAVKIYLVMAIGCEILCRMRHVPSNVFSVFPVHGPDVIRLCLEAPSFETVQVLMLLALYSTFDPKGCSPWSVTGILGRQAVLLGLNRRSSSNSGLSLAEIESRHRLFWSIFSADRLVSVSYGLPFSIDDPGIAVPLPGVTMDEFGASDQLEYLTTLQVARQAICLRQIGATILAKTHMIGDSKSDFTEQTLRRRDRDRIKGDLRRLAEDWYTQGCLLIRAEPKNVPIHNTIAWLNVNYYEMLMLLCSPSRLNEDLTLEELLELRQVIHKYIQYAHAQFEPGHLALNTTTLNRFIVVSRLILHCHVWGNLGPSEVLADADVAQQGADIMEGFTREWNMATSIGVLLNAVVLLFRQSSTDALDAPGSVAASTASSSLVLQVQEAPLIDHSSNDGKKNTMSDPYKQEVLGVIIEECDLLLEKALGASSVYMYTAFEGRQP